MPALGASHRLVMSATRCNVPGQPLPAAGVVPHLAHEELNGEVSLALSNLNEVRSNQCWGRCSGRVGGNAYERYCQLVERNEVHC